MPFNTALSGLNAASTDLSVTANNIANAGTAGFKQSRTEFVDVYALAFAGVSSTTPGIGVRVADISQQFTQGNIDYTNSNLDLAIKGLGFFTLEDSGARVYARAGAFHVDRNGYVVNSEGQELQAYAPIGNTGTFNTGALNSLQLLTTTGAPNASTLITAGLNVDASRTPFTVTGLTDNKTTVFDPANPNTYHNSTALAVYDSLGTLHTATMYYRKVDTALGTLPNSWQTFLYIDGTEVPPVASAAGTPGTMTFNPNGTLNTVSPVGSTSTRLGYSAYVPTTGASNITLEIDYNDTSQYGTAFGVNSLIQDGFTTGQLSSIDVDSSGVVFARFTNGQTSTLGKLAMGNFTNPQGLRQLGDSVWAESFESGNVILGEAGTASFGLIQQGALEASNVDISEQLVNLITAQRNFQANAQVITTADTITQTIINIR
ncbi:MAG: flagellar hook protein FlgE [Gammaproteobacteria bacterium RBG_16_57_12]|nr:MAG: flagellar hook protein FlgE [Gammaproteobacteria bacterium RBG_16_57_12]